MKKKSSITTEDQNLFRDAVKDVRPIKKQNRVNTSSRLKKTQTVKKSHNEQQTVSERYRVSDFIQDENFCSHNENLSYKSAGLQHQQLKKLRQGKLKIEATLDLHGLNINQARAQVDLFVQDCQAQNFRCVSIIHGKGSHGKMPILKSMVNHWLQQIPDILAFSSAQPMHGGAGALYVLLKRKR